MRPERTVEIAAFRATSCIDDATPARYADAVRDWLASQSSFVASTLSCDQTGIWTDHLVWNSPAEAAVAGGKFPSAPGAAASMAAIDPANAPMRRAPIVLPQTEQPTCA